MQLRSALLACALVGATGLATHAEEADRFRLAGWEVEQAIPRPSLGEVGPLKPADFGLDAFPVSPLVAEANNPDDEAPETVQAPPVPQPTEADFAAMPDDPPSLVEAGQPDPAITAERVAQQLRVLLARPGGDRALQQGFNPFYAGRAYQPLFVKDGIISERGQQVLNRLSRAGEDGLDPSAYRIELPTGQRNAESVARLELALAQAVARYASHASGGRTDPKRLSGYFDVAPPRIETSAALTTLAGATDVAAAIDGFNPPHEGFRALRAKLIEMRGERREMTTTEASRLHALRGARPHRQSGALALAAADPRRDPYLGEFAGLPRQRGARGPGHPSHPRRHGPPGDADAGLLRRHELHRLQPVLARAAFHRAALDAGLGGAQWRLFRPPRHPGHAGWAGGRCSTINWASANIGRYSFRQPPGNANALGRMKFMFPNRHAVYLHDTPSRSYFAHSNRALSNGCVRVQNPRSWPSSCSASPCPATAGRPPGCAASMARASARCASARPFRSTSSISP